MSKPINSIFSFIPYQEEGFLAKIRMGIEKQKDTLKFLWQLTLKYNGQSFIRSSSLLSH
jgi:hypothetical protein